MSSDPLDRRFRDEAAFAHVLKAADSLVGYHDIRVLARAETHLGATWTPADSHEPPGQGPGIRMFQHIPGGGGNPGGAGGGRGSGGRGASGAAATGDTQLPEP